MWIHLFFGGIFDEEFTRESKAFFFQVEKGKYIIVLSQITLDELEEAPEYIKEYIFNLPEGSIEEVNIDKEVTELAKTYINAEVLPQSSEADAFHVAAATIARVDLILSWNFKHLVNYDKIHKFNGINILNGFQQIEIHSPLELGDDYED